MTLARLIGGGIVGAAVFVSALAVLYRSFRIGELRKGTRDFLRDWAGDPSRPGVDAVPSFPERMAAIEKRTMQLERNSGKSLADTVHNVARDVKHLDEGVNDLRNKAKDSGDAIQSVDQRIGSLDERVSDHRRRNDLQAEQLRAYLEQRLNDAEKNRNLVAILTELGYEMELPKTRNKPE